LAGLPSRLENRETVSRRAGASRSCNPLNRKEGTIPGTGSPQKRDWLATLERVGNRLPDPATLFFLGTPLVLLISQVADSAGWTVRKVVAGEGGEREQVVAARGLLESDGIWWLLSHMVENFITFPPLGMVLAAMLGIGLAERSGLLPALIRRSLGRIPAALVSPAVLLVGILSSLTLDAGYVVLPPLAAGLFASQGRSPLAGIAVAFAGVSAGFSANFVLTGLDPLLAGLSESGARILDPDYRVAVTANWWFMIASTLLLPLVGWWVSARVVEPRLANEGLSAHGEDAMPDARNERQGLRAAGVALAVTVTGLALLVFVPGAPLNGTGERFARWVEAIVPLILLVFLIPGLAFGVGAGTVRSDRDAAGLMARTMADMGPYIVLAFFAAQFIESFRYSHLGEMLAVAGGQVLSDLALPPALLMVAFVLVVMAGNLLIGSASAKYAFFAPVFVPMFMQAGVSPELTQAAYRVGDSVTNIITPLNPYMVIVLSLMQRYAPAARLGTLVATMLPYTLAFALVWLILLSLWVLVGWPLGPGGPLTYAG
jgi:aminobenzoyl-glutamate transport protein